MGIRVNNSDHGGVIIIIVMALDMFYFKAL